MDMPPPRSFECILESSRYCIAMDLPGCNRDDVGVNVSPYRVNIVIRSGGEEWRTDGFEKSIRLLEECNPELSEARINNGVLEVLLPLKVKVGPEKINASWIGLPDYGEKWEGHKYKS